MTTLSSWFLVTRPKTLLVALAVILLGQTLAWVDSPVNFSFYIATLCMVCCMALQIAVNLSNDYFDGKSGVDGDDRLGPDRALQKGLISAAHLRLGIIAMCLLAIVSGCYLIYVGGWPYVILGILSLLGVYIYSGGPRPLASHGLGELAVFLYFGWLAVVGSYYLQSQVLTFAVFIPASQVGFLVVAIMLVNNIRDVASDFRAQKFTLATRLGVKASKHLYCLTVLLPSLLLVIDSYQGLLMLLLLPVQLALCVVIYQRDGKQLNAQLAQTSMLVLLWGGLYSVDLMVR
ncbi:MAG: 1,4-dihydroxy-2-naphthoate octaprenyltransferase [Moritella sp.]|uniref:1,4-dihydroxy-2-naphthoate octaprenyltransferase n=1 Tax=unclassified Moritella TaxID=2637987 RepID=UPI000156890A|nr:MULTISPECIES: 1,4-dihydroxy-2-naphthoate octaprenyltransferase [unclassified Moritella]EDM66930.1 1,4-dihydroxy-2-naphthoate octaprenyltransferase, putative [Moritella sp. PE36]MBL1418220.1 1,4-dihydroxy-2-naphthoate octaprenyltransferase [Moritella sp.]PHR87560.1 MAG: 1,4-dihydroxy-2-naphthoate octaprenyltransferase [Moritella sp.]